MKAVRVGAALYAVGPLACPRCGRRDTAHRDGYGILRQTCEGKHCHVSWEAIRLPPGATMQQLEPLFGVEVAGVLAEHPLFGVEVSTEPVYAQRAPDTPEPLMGWRRASAILFSLFNPGTP